MYIEGVSKIRNILYRHIKTKMYVFWGIPDFETNPYYRDCVQRDFPGLPCNQQGGSKILASPNVECWKHWLCMLAR